MNEQDQRKKERRRIIYLVIGIILLWLAVIGTTFAYYTFNASNNGITGEAGDVDLKLTITKILPTTSGTDDILITNFDELADALNQQCIDQDGEFALCQLYQVNIANNSSGVNTNLTGSISFNNSTAPNLSWLLVEDYDSSNTYTSTMLGSSYQTASSEFSIFVTNYLLEIGTNKNFYLLVWVNESEEEQTDEGSYSATVRFEDSSGSGVTSTFVS